jgi:hypothetical protein
VANFFNEKGPFGFKIILSINFFIFFLFYCYLRQRFI